ncbi:MAG: hypothetical protein ACRDZX_00825 [Acidimicrobiales bacterium]
MGHRPRSLELARLAACMRAHGESAVVERSSKGNALQARVGGNNRSAAYQAALRACGGNFGANITVPVLNLSGVPPGAFLKVNDLVPPRVVERGVIALLPTQGELDRLLVESAIAPSIMAVVSIGLGWVMAGRALRPLRAMTVSARQMSEENLHERLALSGYRRRPAGPGHRCRRRL